MYYLWIKEESWKDLKKRVKKLEVELLELKKSKLKKKNRLYGPNKK